MVYKHALPRVFEVFFEMLTERETTLAEFWSSSVLGLWGISLLIGPTGSFDTDAYLPLRATMHAWEWATVFLFVAILQVWANLTHRFPVRKVAAFLSSLAFGAVACSSIGTREVLFYFIVFGTASFVQGIIYFSLSLRGLLRGSRF